VGLAKAVALLVVAADGCAALARFATVSSAGDAGVTHAIGAPVIPRVGGSDGVSTRRGKDTIHGDER